MSSVTSCLPWSVRYVARDDAVRESSAIAGCDAGLADEHGVSSSCGVRGSGSCARSRGPRPDASD